MTRKSLRTLKTIPDQTERILNGAGEHADIALHEAAHLVAAVICRVHVTHVWVKGTRARTDGRGTKGSSGAVHAHPYDLKDDALISYAGYAWEELYGDTCYAANDEYWGSRRGSPAELEAARALVQKYTVLIRQAAAAVLVLRTAQGMVENKTLNDLYEWIKVRTHPYDRLTTRLVYG